MFGSTGPGPYDLHFRVFGIPVRVQPFFWLVAALFGDHNLRLGMDFMLGWILVFFISILVHELGHALTAMYFGFPVQIVLYGMGGQAQYVPRGRYGRGQSLAITLAGPGAGFALAAIGYILLNQLQPALANAPMRTQQLIHETLSDLVLVNVFWSIMNLFPVLPLDGGRVCQDVLTFVSPRQGQDWTHWVGVIVGGLVGAMFLSIGAMWGGILFVMMAAQNYMMLQGPRWR